MKATKMSKNDSELKDSLYFKQCKLNTTLFVTKTTNDF